MRKDVSCCVILNKQNEVLLQKKTMSYPWFPGKWCLFGGGIKSGESPEQTVKRELKEELRYKVNNLRFFGIAEYEDKCYLGTRKGRQHIFVSNFDGKISDFLLHEGAGFAFFAESELNLSIINYNDLCRIQEYFRKQ